MPIAYVWSWMRIHFHFPLLRATKRGRGSSCFTVLNQPPAWVLSHFSRVRLCATPWTVACQAPLSMGFSRQEYWSRLPCPPPGNHPDPGIKPKSLTSPALAGRSFTTSTTGEALNQPHWPPVQFVEHLVLYPGNFSLLLFRNNLTLM